jgi:hypothetical protein
MKACEICGIALEDGECIFAVYETEVEGKKVVMCCTKCASESKE